VKKLKIIMTGGGSAGHVTPNLALIPRLMEEGYEVQYIGTKDGIERKIIEGQNVKYHIISSGKLRRYFDVKNFSDPFKVIKGIYEAQRIIREQKPDVVFSKGGFVAVPVVIGAYLNKVPVVAHESDLTPGLANRLSVPYCSKICVTFPESLSNIKKEKGILTGTPIRKELLLGSRIKGLRFCGFNDSKPVLMIIGGSLGAAAINEAVRKSLTELMRKYNIIHICGKDNVEEKLNNKPGYRQFEYVSEELPDLMQAADLVVSRAGANTIFELLALRKPNLLIPLSKKSSRGDQLLNAASFERSGYSIVLQEEELSQEALMKKLEELYNNRGQYISSMSASPVKSGVEKIIEVIKANTKK
jgi:UDP-N-acetylglucosamine--N-acetylmuramyl-(pentapeptide) pyrophosphoryl-undecaprenol N-acetylglucosamine transferase